MFKCPCLSSCLCMFLSPSLHTYVLSSVSFVVFDRLFGYVRVVLSSCRHYTMEVYLCVCDSLQAVVSLTVGTPTCLYISLRLWLRGTKKGTHRLRQISYGHKYLTKLVLLRPVLCDLSETALEGMSNV